MRMFTEQFANEDIPFAAVSRYWLSSSSNGFTFEEAEAE